MKRHEWESTRVVGEEAAHLMKGPPFSRARWAWMVTAPYPQGHEAHGWALGEPPALRVQTGTARTKVGAMLASARVLAGWAKEDGRE